MEGRGKETKMHVKRAENIKSDQRSGKDFSQHTSV